MRIGLQPDRDGVFFAKWSQFLTMRGAEVVVLDLLGSDALEQAKQCDGIMWRWFHYQEDKQSARVIMHTIENYLGIPIFPSVSTSWHFDDKVAQFYLLAALKAPQPQAWVFWERERALAWTESASYPVVFKLTAGAGSSNVLKIDTASSAQQLIHRIFDRGIFPMTMNEYRPPMLPRTRRELRQRFVRFADAAKHALTGDMPTLPDYWWKPEKGYAYFQEFLPGNDYDTRVTIIGDRAFAFRRMNRPGDFRASGSGRIDHDPTQINLQCLKIAFEISEKAGFQTMAYDFLFKEGKPVICEISYTFMDTAVYDCPGQWDKKMNWHEGKRWPEDVQVEMFLDEVANRIADRGPSKRGC